MASLGATEALALLLRHGSRDVVFAAAGALVNVAADAGGRDSLRRADVAAHAELARVVRAASLRDLGLAAVACKALHNLLLDAPTGGAATVLGETHERLRDTLVELLDCAEDASTLDAGAGPDPANADFLRAGRAVLGILEE